MTKRMLIITFWPQAFISLYNKENMTGRGRGKYWYKKELREDGEKFLREQMKKYFPNNPIEYIV